MKEEQLQILKTRDDELEMKINEAKHTTKFAEDILKEGTDIEILTFIDAILTKLHTISILEEDLIAPKLTENVQFLENEIKEDVTNKFALYGVLSTQKVSLEYCIIKKEGK